MRNDLFEKMEIEILQLISDKHTALSDQLENVKIVKRDFTGVGFFSDFKNNNREHKGITETYYADGILNKDIQVGFILFTEDGNLSFLEGFTYGDEPWPETIKEYKIFIE